MTNIFEGKLIRLRAEEPSDAAIFRNRDLEETESIRSVYQIPFPQPRLDAPQPPKPYEGDSFPFVIETLSGDVVGGIHPHHCNPRWGTFMYGISIFPDHRQKGYAHEAIWLVLRYYFDEKRYQKCSSEIYSFNEASIKLHEGLGFIFEGRQRRMIYTNGEFHDMLFYGITIEEFQAKDQT